MKGEGDPRARQPWNRAATLAGRATPRWLLRRVSGAMVRRLKKAD